jgi:hypothetical protein
MRRLPLLITAVLFIALAWLSTALQAAKAETAKTKCIKFAMETQLLGPLIVHVSTGAIAIQLIGHETKVVSCAPDWKVYSFCDRTRRVYLSRLENYRPPFATGLALLFGDEFGRIRWHQGKSSMIFGKEIKRYTGQGTSGKNTGDQNLFCVLEDPRIKTQSIGLFFRVTGFDRYTVPRSGLPIFAEYFDSQQGRQNILRTKAILDTLVESSFFAPPPKSYVFVKKMSEITGAPTDF